MTWRTRNLKTLSAVSFAQDAASELLYPILPIFITVTLGAPVVVVGMIEGLAEGAAAITKLISGKISDGRARKPIIFLGYLLAAIGKLLVALAFVWPIALLGRVVDRLGKGIRGAPRDALLVMDIPVEDRGKAIGFHRAADTAGAVVGPLIGLLIIHFAHGSLRTVLWIALIPAALSVFFIKFVKETVPPKRVDASAGHGVLPAELKRLVLLMGIFGLVNFPDALILLHLHQIGFSTFQVVALYALFNLSYALLAYPLGALADRIPKHRIFAGGLFAFAIAYIGLSQTDSKWISILLLLVYGGFAACNDAVGKSWVAKIAPNDRQGSAQGLFQGVSGGAILIAGIWAGLSWGEFGNLPLLISGVVAIFVAIALWRDILKSGLSQ
ncbi:MAG: MFS transporter [Actinobacteria bacterium]|nr:MAG: MFS transporter [Actinomycetota bacterium]